MAVPYAIVCPTVVYLQAVDSLDLQGYLTLVTNAVREIPESNPSTDWHERTWISGEMPVSTRNGEWRAPTLWRRKARTQAHTGPWRSRCGTPVLCPASEQLHQAWPRTGKHGRTRCFRLADCIGNRHDAGRSWRGARFIRCGRGTHASSQAPVQCTTGVRSGAAANGEARKLLNDWLLKYLLSAPINMSILATAEREAEESAPLTMR